MNNFSSLRQRAYKKLAFSYHQIENARRKRTDKKLSKKAAKDNKIVWRLVPSGGSSKRCYFASFDPDGIVDEHVFHFLRQLGMAGYEIVFITTSPGIRDQDLERLKSSTIAVILRVNLGHDFFSWKIGLQACPILDSTEEVVLTNDSVYGPIYDLGNYIRRMRSAALDVVGMSDSWRIQYHLQSYFLLFKGNILRSDLLKDFFRKVQVVSDQMDMRKAYEIGISKLVLKSGYKIGAICDFREIYKKYYSTEIRLCSEELYQKVMNPTNYFWKELIRDKHIPFLKTNVLSVLVYAE